MRGEKKAPVPEPVPVPCACCVLPFSPLAFCGEASLVVMAFVVFPDGEWACCLSWDRVGAGLFDCFCCSFCPAFAGIGKCSPASALLPGVDGGEMRMPMIGGVTAGAAGACPFASQRSSAAWISSTQDSTGQEKRKVFSCKEKRPETREMKACMVARACFRFSVFPRQSGGANPVFSGWLRASA